MAWSDYRGQAVGGGTNQSGGDIFGIRLDAQGQPIDAMPFLIAGGMGLQQRPQVAWNGEAWLVLYISQDPVGGYFEDRMRAVRVSAQGQVLDATPIVFPPSQFIPDTIGLQVAGQNGQWLMVRCIYHDDGYGTKLVGQRLDGDGTLLDPTPRLLIDWVYGQTKILAADGEYLVAGSDFYDSVNTQARRIGLDAQPIGAAFSVPSLNLATDGSEYYVTWISNYVNLVGSRVTSDGTLLTPAGTLIVANFSQYDHSTITHDGTQWWFEWGVSDQLHTVRIDAAGNVLDPERRRAAADRDRRQRQHGLQPGAGPPRRRRRAPVLVRPARRPRLRHQRLHPADLRRQRPRHRALRLHRHRQPAHCPTSRPAPPARSP